MRGSGGGGSSWDLPRFSWKSTCSWPPEAATLGDHKAYGRFGGGGVGGWGRFACAHFAGGAGWGGWASLELFSLLLLFSFGGGGGDLEN